MRKVMVFGTFDILHPGHRYFLSQAKKQGDYLVVVIARDLTVKQVKGELPVNNQHQRLRQVDDLDVVDRAILGKGGDKYQVIEQEKPNLICLGYDQTSFTENLRGELDRRKLPHVKVMRLKAYKKGKHKSSKIKGTHK